MLNLGTPELLVIAVVALLVLGPTKLPDAARSVGKAMAEMRRMSSGFKDEMDRAMKEPTTARAAETDMAAEAVPTAPRPRRAAPLEADRPRPRKSAQAA